MPGEINMTGELVEISRLDGEECSVRAVIRRPDGSTVTIKGLRTDEVKGMASFFLDQVTVVISERAK